MEFRELKELSCLSLCNWCLTLYNEPAVICFSWGFYERKKHKESEKEELLFHSPMSPLPPFCALTQPRPCKAILCWGSFWWGLPVLVGLWPPSAFVCYLQASLTHLELSTAEAYCKVAQIWAPLCWTCSPSGSLALVMSITPHFPSSCFPFQLPAFGSVSVCPSQETHMVCCLVHQICGL